MTDNFDASQTAPACQQGALVTEAAATVPQAKPLDLSHVLRHAFLAGFVAARDIPAHEPCDGNKCWLEFDPTNNPAYKRLRALITLATRVEGESE